MFRPCQHDHNFITAMIKCFLYGDRVTQGTIIVKSPIHTVRMTYKRYC